MRMLGRLKARRATAALIFLLIGLYGFSCQASTGPTSEFTVRYHGVVAGAVSTSSGVPVPGAQVFAHFPGISGGATSRDATTDAGGLYSLLVEHFGFPAAPELNDSLVAYIVSVERPGGSEQGEKDSASVVVKFRPVSEPRPTTQASIVIRGLP